MIPTIDISFIGICVAIWTVLKTALGWVMHGINFISQKALALLIGSKFWATLAFLVAYLAVCRLVVYVVTLAASYVLDLVFSHVDYGIIRASLNYLGTVLNLRRVAQTITFFFAMFVSYRLFQARILWFSQLYSKFMGLLKSWKT